MLLNESLYQSALNAGMVLEARPITGGPSSTAVTGDNQSYSLEVKPGVPYYLSGGDNGGRLGLNAVFSGPGGYNVIYTYPMPPGNNTITVSSNETVLLDATVSRFVFA